jgi:hypothetical protein
MKNCIGIFRKRNMKKYENDFGFIKLHINKKSRTQKILISSAEIFLINCINKVVEFLVFEVDFWESFEGIRLCVFEENFWGIRD